MVFKKEGFFKKVNLKEHNNNDGIFRKKLAEVTVAKKRYRFLFVMAFVALIVLLGIVYNNVVLDYAVLDNVQIKRPDDTNNIFFRLILLKRDE